MRRLLVAVALFIAGAATGAGALATWTAARTAGGDAPEAMARMDDGASQGADGSTGAPSALPPGPFGTPTPRGPTHTPTPAFAPGFPRPTPTPTPAPPTTRGVATPAGTFVVRRGDALVLLRLDRPGSEYELQATGNGPRFFVGSTQVPQGVEVYFGEAESPTTGDGQASVVLYRLPADGGPPGRVLGYTFPGRFAAESASVTASGRYLAYSSADGVHVHNLRSGEDRLVVPSPCTPDPNAPRTEPRPAVGFAGCGSIDVRPIGSPDARHLIFQRLYIEGSRWHVIDLLADAPVPLPLPWQFIRSWGLNGAQVCATDGDGYVGPPRAAFAYDFATSSAGWLRVSSRDVGTQAIVGACAWSPNGEVAVSYGSSRGTPLVVVFSGQLDALRSTSAPGVVVAWLPDSSGVVLRGVTGERPERREPFYLVDRDGEVWSLPIVADEIVAILP